MPRTHAHLNSSILAAPWLLHSSLPLWPLQVKAAHVLSTPISKDQEKTKFPWPLQSPDNNLPTSTWNLGIRDQLPPPHFLEWLPSLQFSASPFYIFRNLFCVLCHFFLIPPRRTSFMGNDLTSPGLDIGYSFLTSQPTSVHPVTRSRPRNCSLKWKTRSLPWLPQPTLPFLTSLLSPNLLFHLNEKPPELASYPSYSSSGLHFLEPFKYSPSSTPHFLFRWHLSFLSVKPPNTDQLNLCHLHFLLSHLPLKKNPIVSVTGSTTRLWVPTLVESSGAQESSIHASIFRPSPLTSSHLPPPGPLPLCHLVTFTSYFIKTVRPPGLYSSSWFSAPLKSTHLLTHFPQSQRKGSHSPIFMILFLLPPPRHWFDCPSP